jgi:hypothetical protein
VIQPLDSWLDQVALPLVIHALGGRPGVELHGLDRHTTYHYRALPLLYATVSDAQVAFLEELTAPNKIKKQLKLYEPFKRMIYQKRGLKVRDMFDRANLPRREGVISNKIKSAGFWMC